jgi:hypothetical protein
VGRPGLREGGPISYQPRPSPPPPLPAREMRVQGLGMQVEEWWLGVEG